MSVQSRLRRRLFLATLTSVIVAYIGVYAFIGKTVEAESRVPTEPDVESAISSTPSLSAFVISPFMIKGGKTAAGEIRLSSVAGPGGHVISLTSDNPRALLPETIIIPENQDSVTFAIQTKKVSSTKTVNVVASSVGATANTALSLVKTGGVTTSLSLNPTSVHGGSSSQGTVTLSSPAPSGGAVVSVLSANKNVASVPVTVTVSSGSRTASFNVTTFQVQTTTSVKITVFYGLSSSSQTLSVTPASPPPSATLSSLSLNPTSVIGATTSQGTVTLSAAAPSGGAVVSLSSSNTGVATVPASVTVSAGSISATFTVTSKTVSSTSTASISGSYNSTSRSATLTVNPPAPSGITVTPANPQFNAVAGGAFPPNLNLQIITSTGQSWATFDTSPWFDAHPTSGASGAATALSPHTESMSPGTYTQTIRVRSAGLPDRIVTVTLVLTASTSASLSAVSVSPTSVIGGSTTQGTATLSSAAPSGGAVVSLSSSNSSVATVPASVNVQAGATSANFTVGTSAVASTNTVSITGSYSSVSKSATLTVNPSPAGTLSSLTLNPTSVVGGGASQGTVTLNGLAPSGGAVVSLSSSKTSVATVPASVTISAGSSSASFTVSTTGVQNTTSVSISGNYASVTTGSSLTVTPAPPAGNNFYVSPGGSPSGNGSISSPWDLKTALSQPAGVVPGVTIYLRGGTYSGKFISQLEGTSALPITVRSYPGEWAVIDGYVTTTLNGAINSNTRTVTLANAANFPDGSTVSIADQSDPGSEEQMSLVNKSGNTFVNAQRGWNSTTPQSHTSGAKVVLGGDQLKVSGSYCVYRDFEIKNTDPIRTQIPANSQNAPHIRGEGLFILGHNNRFVNLTIHDCQEGVFVGDSGYGSEVYGCIIYNNGYVAGGAYNGHGLYLLHSNTANTAYIKDSIVFNNNAIGVKGDSQNGNAVNIWVEGTVSFNNGSWTQSNQRRWGILMASNNGIADLITVKNNFLFIPSGFGGEQLKLGLGGLDNGRLSVTGNFIGGGGQAINISRWTPLTVTGNTVHAKNNQGGGNSQLAYYEAHSSASNISWNANTYWNEINQAKGFFPTPQSSSLVFSQWKSNTGFDASSTHNSTTPTSNWISVRKNAYDNNRANIIVYNWTGGSTVSVDVSSVLSSGDSYAVYAAENYTGSPVLTGVYTGGSIALPMSGGTVAQPVGWTTAIATVRPTFGAFVLKKTN